MDSIEVTVRCRKFRPPGSEKAKKKIRGDRRVSDASDLPIKQDDSCVGPVRPKLKSDMQTQSQQTVSGPDHPTCPGSERAKKQIRGDRRVSDASDLPIKQDDSCVGPVRPKLKSDMQTQSQQTVSGPDHPTCPGSERAKKQIRGDRRVSDASDLPIKQDDSCVGPVRPKLKSDMQTQSQQTVSGPDHPTCPGSERAKKQIRGDRRVSDASDLPIKQDDNFVGPVRPKLKSDMQTQSQQTVSGPDHPTCPGSERAKKQIRGDRRVSDASDLPIKQDDSCVGPVRPKLKSDMQTQSQQTVSGPDHPTCPGSERAKKQIRGDRRVSDASDLPIKQDDSCVGPVPPKLKFDMQTQSQQTISLPDHPTRPDPPEEAWLFGASTGLGVLAKVIAVCRHISLD